MNRSISRSIAALLFVVPAVASGQGGQPSITSVVFNPTSVPGGRPATATITISGPAGNNGFEIALSITSNTAQLGAAAVTVGSGQTTASVQVTTTPTTSLQLAVLSATARGDTRTANLTITPPSATSFALAPGSVAGGQSSTGTITLDGAAPAGGTTVTLSSSSPAASLPSTITVTQGQTSRAVSVSTSAVSAQTNATITATAGGTSRTATLTVQPPPLSIASIGFPSNAKSGDTVTVSAQANGPAPAGGLVVALASTGVELFGGSGILLTIPAGQTSISSGRFAVPLIDRDRSFTITARANGITTSRSGTLLGPRVTSLALADSVVAGNPVALTANLDAPTPFGIPVVITSSSPAITAPGSTNSDFSLSQRSTMYTLQSNPVQQRTNVTITLTNSGESKTTTIVVIPGASAQVSAVSASPLVARAGGSIVLTVTLDRLAPSGGTVIELFSQGVPAGMTVPSTLTVPSGARSASVTIAAPSRLGSSVSVTLGARAGGSAKSVVVRIDPSILD